MEAPKRATKFAANDKWGKFYRELFGQQTMTQSLSVLTGASAGATESFVVVPFELVKIRLQDRTSKYTGMVDVVVKTVRNEGILGMYNGLESTLWRHILWNAGYFGCIFQTRRLVFENCLSLFTAVSGTVTVPRRTRPDIPIFRARADIVASLLPKAETKKGQILNDIMAGTVGGTVGTILNTVCLPSPHRCLRSMIACEAIPPHLAYE